MIGMKDGVNTGKVAKLNGDLEMKNWFGKKINNNVEISNIYDGDVYVFHGWNEMSKIIQCKYGRWDICDK